MLLRASSQNTGDDPNLTALTAEGEGGETGIPFGAELMAFTNAVLDSDDNALTSARDALTVCVGNDGAVDAAAVVAMFTTNDRIADATGIPLDALGEEGRRSIASEMQIEGFEGNASA